MTSLNHEKGRLSSECSIKIWFFFRWKREKNYYDNSNSNSSHIFFFVKSSEEGNMRMFVDMNWSHLTDISFSFFYIFLLFLPFFVGRKKAVSSLSFLLSFFFFLNVCIELQIYLHFFRSKSSTFYENMSSEKDAWLPEYHEYKSRISKRRTSDLCWEWGQIANFC